MSNNKDWILRRIWKLYQSYFEPIKARSSEGRAYIMHALYAVFLSQGLDAERIGPDSDQPFDPATGEGYIMVNDYVVVDVTQVECLRRDVVDRFDGRIPHGRHKSILLNFGSTQPEYYPPEDGNIADFLAERDDDYDDNYYYEMPSEE